MAIAIAQTRAQSDPPVVVCQRLTKVFKDFWMRDRARAVDGIDLEVRPREVFGLLGPNGSGKSTTIKMILGLLRPSGGRVAVFGKPPTDVGTKRRIGYLPEESYLYPFLNARETLDYYAKLFELDSAVRRRRIDELLDMVGLTGAQHRPVREYSKGMQRRIGLAQALINDPDLLILDEPTTGLDPIGTKQVKDLIIELGRRGKTIILSSHLLSDVEDCVDRLVILYGGLVRAEGTCDSLLESQSRTTIETDTLDEATVSEVDRVLRQHTHGEKSVLRVSRPRQRLEDLFLDIVQRARQEQLSTSGATSGGQTASFLRAGAGGGEGDGAGLIDDLVNAQPEPAAGVRSDAPAPRAAPSAPAGPDADVIASLTRDAANEAEAVAPNSPAASSSPAAPRSAAAPTAAPAPRREVPARTPAAPVPAQNVDTSLIDALLDSGDSGPKAPGGGRTP